MGFKMVPVRIVLVVVAVQFEILLGFEAGHSMPNVVTSIRIYKRSIGFNIM